MTASTCSFGVYFNQLIVEESTHTARGNYMFLLVVLRDNHLQTTKSDQPVIPPFDIYTLPSKEVMRTFNPEDWSCCLSQNQILITNLQRNVWQLEGRINNHILEVKALTRAEYIWKVTQLTIPQSNKLLLRENLLNTKLQKNTNLTSYSQLSVQRNRYCILLVDITSRELP